MSKKRMKQIKSLADQIRERTALQVIKPEPSKTKETKRQVKKATQQTDPPLITDIQKFEYASGKNTIHVRLDEKTATLLSQLKMASGIDQVKLVAFAVKDLFDRHPELKSHIKNYLQNLDL